MFRYIDEGNPRDSFTISFKAEFILAKNFTLTRSGKSTSPLLEIAA